MDNRTTLFITLSLLGILGNIYNIEMFFGVNQIFGSIFVLLSVSLLGVRLGLLSAIIVHSYTLVLWGHPYAFIGFVLEAFVVGLLLKKVKNIFIADMLYWVFLGVWLVPIFYGKIMELPELQVTLIMLKQFANGVFNALFASIIAALFLHYKENQKIRLQYLIYTTTIAFVIFSLYITANLLSQNSFKHFKSTMIEELKIQAKHIVHESKHFHSDRELDHYIKEYIYKSDVKFYLEDLNQSTHLSGHRRMIEPNIYHLLPSKKMPKMVAWKESHFIYELALPHYDKRVVIAASFSYYVNELQKIYIFIFSIMLVVIIMVALISYYFSQQLVSSLKQLARSTDDLPQKLIHKEKIVWSDSVIAEISDITQNFEHISKVLQNILQESEDRYLQLFENSKNPIVVIDSKTYKIIDTNVVSNQLIPKVKEQNIFELIEGLQSSDLELERDISQKLFRLHSHCAIPIRLDVQYFNSSYEEIIMLTLYDISSEVEALQNQKLIKMVFETTAEGILITDKDQKILMVNSGYTTITGYRGDEVIGKMPKIVHSGWQDEEFYTQMWEGISQKGQWEGEIWNRRKDGTLFAEWITIYEVRDHEGAVSNYIGVFVDITEKKRTQERINQLAYYDTLTGLPNRRLFQERISQALKKAEDKKVALMFIDLDNFKSVNDTLGHDVGDLLLKEVSQRVLALIPKNDTFARIGGDEFTVILEDVEHKSDTVHIVQEIIHAFKMPFEIKAREIYASVSIGIAMFPDDALSMDEMMKCADSAMYRAKEKGKQGFEFYESSTNLKALRQLEIEDGLRKAIKRGELALYYQPQIDIESGQIVGVEALLRWIKKGQFISPNEFIPIAESSGLIGEIELWVLKQGARDLQIFQEAGIDIVMSLNISDYQFKKEEFITQTKAMIGCQGEGCKGFNLELTERIIMDSKSTQSKLDELKAFGFQLSLDDFGTGYSSLSYLKKFNIDKLKIDKSFIDDIEKDQQSLDIAHAIVSLAKSMGMETIAEGVENQQQLDIIRNLGCDIYQGWYFSKAIKPQEFMELYKKAL